MPPLSRTVSTWMSLVIFSVAVSLGLAAAAPGALAQTTRSPNETDVVGSAGNAKDGQRASVATRAKRHDQAGTGRSGPAARSPVAGRSAPFLTEAQISTIKSGLKLTPHQEKYWPAVEAALRRLAFRKTPEGATVLDPDSMQGLYTAAADLVESLDASQLGEAQRLARLVGLAN